MAKQEQFETKFTLIKAKDGLVKAINNFFKELLSKTALEGILVPHELPNGSGFIPSLIIDLDTLSGANALAPIMPVNASKAVSDLTRLKPSKSKLGVLLKACEHRALIELVKLKQVNLENLVIIGIDCPGTYPIQTYSEDKGNKKLNTESLLKSFTKFNDNPELRGSCQVCEHFAPLNADIIIGLYGLDPKKQFLVGITSDAGEQVLEPLQLNFKGADSEVKKRSAAIAKLTEQRLKLTSLLEKDTQNRIFGLENFLTELSACINCHNCMTVCPICYCKECFFESPTFDLEADKYIKMANRKGALRIPSNMFLFHVTRFNHMGLSCVACGMCEQGCPANIPLLSIYKTVGKKAQEVFTYEPGRSLAEEIPILTFKEDELEPK
jgi:formate dehydrogenase subunit beta